MNRRLRCVSSSCCVLRRPRAAGPGAGAGGGARRRAEALAVDRNEAVADFPTGITFTLDAETTAPITNLELMYRPPGIDTFSVELPPFDAGTKKLAIDHAVDLRDGHLPPGIDINFHWRITEENGDVIETPEQTVLWSDDRYRLDAADRPARHHLQLRERPRLPKRRSSTRRSGPSPGWPTRTA